MAAGTEAVDCADPRHHQAAPYEREPGGELIAVVRRRLERDCERLGAGRGPGRTLSAGAASARRALGAEATVTAPHDSMRRTLMAALASLPLSSSAADSGGGEVR